MRESLKIERTAPPVALPLSLNEAKAHLRLEDDQTAEDALVMALLRAAADECERYTGRALTTQSWTLWLDRLPANPAGAPWWDGVQDGPIANLNGPASRSVVIPRPPLRSIDLVNTYSDADAVTVLAASNYFVDTASAPGRLVLRSSAAAPSPTRAANGIEIRFTAGYGPDPADLPTPLVEGIKHCLAHLFENRGDDPSIASRESGAERMWRSFRVLDIR